jgi:ribosome maturation protein SDO1
MRIRLTMANKDGKRLKEKIVALMDKVEDEDWADEWEVVSEAKEGRVDWH